MGRQFDGAFIDAATGRGTWYEAKSGNFWENTLKNNRQGGFFSTEGQKFGIATKRGIPYRVISEIRFRVYLRIGSTRRESRGRYVRGGRDEEEVNPSERIDWHRFHV